MSVLARRVPAGGTGMLLPFAGAAALLGVLATWNATYAFALVLAAALTLLVAADVGALPLFLVFAMFVEALALGPGLRIGRLAGAMALVVLALYVLARGVAGLRVNLLLWVSGLYGLWLVASALWATSGAKVLSTFYSYVLAIAYMLAMAVLVRSRVQLTRIFATVAVGSAVFGLLGFVTYALSSTGRSTGLNGDPNFFATYQVIALAPALALAAAERSPRRRLVLYGVVVLVVLSVVSSLSRGGLIALGAVVLATLLLPWRLFFHRRGRKLGYLFALVLAGAIATVAGSARFVERAQTILNPSDTGSGRTDLWRSALHGWRDHPWLGLGAGNYQTQALDLLQSTPGVCTRCGYVAAGRVVHNSYLEALTELGPLGLLLFVGVLVLSARAFVLSARRARAAGDARLERYSIALLVSLLGFCVTAIFLSNELSRGLWVLVGLALALDVITRRLPAAPAGAAYDPSVSDRSLDLRQRELEQRLAALVRDQERLDRRRHALDERERAIAEREAQLASAVAAAPAPAAEPEPEPQRTPPPPRQVAERTWRVDALEHLVARRGASMPERREEWETYLVFLRHQAPDGVLPPSFDALVWEVFGDLLEQK